MPMRFLKREREKWKVGLRARWAFGGPEISKSYFGGAEPSPDYFGWIGEVPEYFGWRGEVPEYFGWRGGQFIPFGAIPQFPPVDVYEENGKLVIVADIPGFKKDEIKVQFKEDQLIISGERKHKEEIEEEKYYRFERYFDTFSRTIKLPVEVDVKNAKAKFQEGTLTITLPIVKKEEPEEIPIEE